MYKSRELYPCVPEKLGLLRPPLRSRYRCSLRLMKHDRPFARGLLPRRIWANGHFDRCSLVLLEHVFNVPRSLSVCVYDMSIAVSVLCNELQVVFSSQRDKSFTFQCFSLSLCTSSQNRASLTTENRHHEKHFYSEDRPGYLSIESEAVIIPLQHVAVISRSVK